MYNIHTHRKREAERLARERKLASAEWASFNHHSSRRKRDELAKTSKMRTMTFGHTRCSKSLTSPVREIFFDPLIEPPAHFKPIGRMENKTLNLAHDRVSSLRFVPDVKRLTAQTQLARRIYTPYHDPFAYNLRRRHESREVQRRPLKYT